VALLAGAGAARLAGEPPGWRAPAAGLSAALIVASLAVRLPGHGATVAVALALLCLAGLVTRPSLEPRALAGGALVGGGVLLMASLPFLSAGRVAALTS